MYTAPLVASAVTIFSMYKYFKSQLLRKYHFAFFGTIDYIDTLYSKHF